MIENENFSNEYAAFFFHNINLLEQAYFGKKKVKGISIKNSVDRKYEDDEIVKKRLEKGIIDEWVVAWKAGRIKNSKIEMLDGNYLNGYGRQMDKEKTDCFLQAVSENCKDIEWINAKDPKWIIDNFSKIYKKVIDSAPIPDFFGAVYIINLIFFMSGGILPIYDKFAHKALKALLMGKRPCEVYVGPAPEDKRNVDEVSAMYMEYLWLLEKTMGKHSIDRKTDRALWVFGHADSEWNLP